MKPPNQTINNNQTRMTTTTATQLTTKFVLNHFNNTLPSNTPFSDVYMELMKSPEKHITLFISTIGSIKYRWDWLKPNEKEEVMDHVNNVIKAIDIGFDNANCLAYVNALREYLSKNGWILL